MSPEEQKFPLERIQQGRLKELEEFIQILLETAHEEIAETILLTMLSRGLPISAITVSLANITSRRGYQKATRLLEQASLFFQEDEP